MSPGATITAPRTRPRPPVRTRDATRTRAASPRAAAPRAAGSRGNTSGAAATATARPLPTPRERPTRHPLRVVEAPGARRNRLFRTRRLVVLGTVLTLITVLTVVAFHVLLAQGQVRLDGLQRDITTAERAYEQARYEHALAASPERIVALATQMGLVAPDRPPIPVAVAGVETGNERASGALDGWPNVKRNLADGP